MIKTKCMLVSKRFIAIFALSAALASCKKTTPYDITGDATVKFFTNITAPGNAPQNSLNYNAVNVPIAAPGFGLANLSHNIPSVIKFPVFASSPVSQDVTIQAVLDTSMVIKYNAIN